MAKCVFCGREETKINGADMREDYYSKCKNQLFKGVSLPFVFHYDTVECRYPDGPYILFQEVDACQECLIRGSGFYGIGALGHYDYSIARNFTQSEDIAQQE